jgi:hypothetical protein
MRMGEIVLKTRGNERVFQCRRTMEDKICFLQFKTITTKGESATINYTFNNYSRGGQLSKFFIDYFFDIFTLFAPQ